MQNSENQKSGRLKGIPFLLLLLLVISLCLQYNHIIFCEAIGLSSFKEIEAGVFVSEEIPVENHAFISETLSKARERVAGFWGKKTGDAVIIVCATPGEYEKYCHSREGAGCSLGTLYGSSFIVLNLHGINTDVISHEMSHNELFKRLGWRKTTFGVPQWFNEGLSMMLDYRFVNAADSVERFRGYIREWQIRTVPPAKRLSLEEISSLNGFFNGDSRHVALAYLTAASEVSYWLMVVGRQGLSQWLETMRNGGSFTSYHEIERLRRRPAAQPGYDNPVRHTTIQRRTE